MVNSRTKGSSFERQLANDLQLELNISFKRDLEQYRASEHGDLIPSNDNFPFLIEAKRYSKGAVGGSAAWWDQAVVAAKRANKLPCLVYKYDRKPVRFVIDVLAAYKAGYKFKNKPPEHGRLEMDLHTFCWIVRELMNEH
jgi:Holliday junction resolvase